MVNWMYLLLVGFFFDMSSFLLKFVNVNVFMILFSLFEVSFYGVFFVFEVKVLFKLGVILVFISLLFGLVGFMVWSMKDKLGDSIFWIKIVIEVFFWEMLVVLWFSMVFFV